MKPAIGSKILAALCLVELLAILWLAGQKTVAPALRAESAPAPGPAQPPARPEPGPGATASAEQEAEQARLVQRNQALESELTAIKQVREEAKSQISIPYGQPRDAGRFVGRTFRKMFEAAAAPDPKEAQERTAENQIRVYSLGPFIQMAEGIESDPTQFAQFQGALVGEVLGLSDQRVSEVESMLADLRTRSLKMETGSPEWAALNDAALNNITALVPAEQKQAVKGQLDFLQQYGVLVIPAYSILRAPTPTVVGPSAHTR